MSIITRTNRASGKRGMFRRTLAGGLVLLLTLSLTVPAWATVFTNSSPITINDAVTIGAANPYPANITVSGMTGNTTNVTVTLNNINHTFPDDIDVMLVGPLGGNLIILSDVGGSDDVTNRTITLDDAAAVTIPDSTTLNSGTFKPTNIGAGDTFPAPAPAPSASTTLAGAFNGTSPNGTWSLYAVDDLGADIGNIANGWSITITTDMTSATTFTNGAPILGSDGARSRATPYASTITSSGLTGAITDVNVTLTNINHLNPDDIDIVLVGPSGKRITLMSDAGGTADVISTTVTFDDAAAAGVPDAGPLVAGTFKPTNFGTGDTFPDLLPTYVYSATAGSATLASVFNGTEPNGTWSLYVVDDATTSAGDIMGGWSVDITAGGSFGSKRFTSSDFDGDGKSDVPVFRSSDRNWYYRESSSWANRVFPAFGDPGDILVPADYDGDRKTDVAVFRPSQGRWFIVQSTTSTLRQVAWGTSGDRPVPADYDGDGLADLAVWRSGVWYVLRSTTGTGRVVSWGSPGDMPIRGHFEGTDGADFAVFRPTENNWYILNNAATSTRVVNFGASGDTLAPADYDGDGKTDVAVFRGSSGTWSILNSSTSATLGVQWGATSDLPVPGDYDGDSRADVAVWRPSTGTWYLLNSGTPPGTAALRIDNWGQSGDLPIPTTYLP